MEPTFSFLLQAALLLAFLVSVLYIVKLLIQNSQYQLAIENFKYAVNGYQEAVDNYQIAVNGYQDNRVCTREDCLTHSTTKLFSFTK